MLAACRLLLSQSPSSCVEFVARQSKMLCLLPPPCCSVFQLLVKQEPWRRRSQLFLARRSGTPVNFASLTLHRAHSPPPDTLLDSGQPCPLHKPSARCTLANVILQGNCPAGCRALLLFSPSHRSLPRSPLYRWLLAEAEAVAVGRRPGAEGQLAPRHATVGNAEAICA